MKHLKISFGIFIILALSRFVPHPPNFTSLIALSFYVPIVFGRKYIPVLIGSFFLTDLVIGFHNVTFFTWGSVVFIGLISEFFKTSLSRRIIGSLLGACIFFIISNFGVWSLGSYPYSFEGLILCYTLAIPFFAYSLISTLIFAAIFESCLKLKSTLFKKLI